MTHNKTRLNPLIIRQTTGDNDEFTGETPDGGVEQEDDNPDIILFENKNKAGIFTPKLDNDPIYKWSRLKRIWVDFNGADTWKIQHVHEAFYDDPNPERVESIFDSGSYSNSKQFWELDRLLGPQEFIRITSTNPDGSGVAELFFDLLWKG